MLDTLRADWRISHDPLSRLVLAVYRYGNWAEHSRLRPLALWPCRVANLLLVRGLAGCDLPRQAQLGPGVQLHHGGRGVAVSKRAVLGPAVRSTRACPSATGTPRACRSSATGSPSAPTPPSWAQ